MTLTFKSQSDKGRKGNRLYISFTHTHAHTLIKKQVRPYVHKQPWCGPSFVLVHTHNQTWKCASVLPVPPHSTYKTHTENTLQREMLYRMRWCQRGADWLYGKQTVLGLKLCVCSLFHISSDFNTHTHTVVRHKHAHTLLVPHSLLACADQTHVKHAFMAIWSFCESCY